MEGLKRDLRDHEQEVRAARSRLESCKQARVRHGRREKELQIAKQRLEDKVEELSEALEKENQDGQLDALQATLNDAEEDKRLNENSYRDSVEALKAINEQFKAIEGELDAKNAEISALDNELSVAQNEQFKVATKRQKILSDKNAVIKRIEDMKRKKEAISQDRAEFAARIHDYSERASIVSPRVEIPAGETPGSLDKKLERLDRDIRRANDECVRSHCLAKRTLTQLGWVLLER